MIPSTQDLIEHVRRGSESEDPLALLAGAAIVASDLAEASDVVLSHYVDQARQRGRSWLEISQVLGVSKQAVHRRFAGTEPAAGIQAGDRLGFHRFTPRTRRVVKSATVAASDRTRQDYVGTEHLLLGMYAEPTAVATRILLAANISEDHVLTAVRSRTPDGAAPPDEQPPWTTRAVKTLRAAELTAADLGHAYIGTEHILLAFFRVPHALAAEILTDCGFDEAGARSRVLAAIDGFEE